MAALPVAPLAGSVDRNFDDVARHILTTLVAPLAGSVDRNFVKNGHLSQIRVAPLAGSVDRNAVPVTPLVEPIGRSPRGERG